METLPLSDMWAVKTNYGDILVDNVMSFWRVWNTYIEKYISENNNIHFSFMKYTGINTTVDTTIDTTVNTTVNTITSIGSSKNINTHKFVFTNMIGYKKNNIGSKKNVVLNVLLSIIGASIVSYDNIIGIEYNETELKIYIEDEKDDKLFLFLCDELESGYLVPQKFNL